MSTTGCFFVQVEYSRNVKVIPPIMSKNKSLIVFKLTEEQRDMMLDSVMFAYEMDIEERNDYDPETFEAMINEVVGSYR